MNKLRILAAVAVIVAAATSLVSPATAAAVPSPVTTVRQAWATATSVTVEWAAADGYGLPVDKYRVEWSLDGATWSSAEAEGTSAQITGLAAGTAYLVRVEAHSTAGWSAPPATPTTTHTWFAVPDAPGNVTAVAHEKSATVQFSEPDNHGLAISVYLILWNDQSFICKTTVCTVGGLPEWQPVTFQVVALNGYGMSARSLPSNTVVPTGRPKPPTKVTAVLARGKVTVSWNPSAANRTTISGYTVTWGSSTKTCSSSPCELVDDPSLHRAAVSVVANSNYGPSDPVRVTLTQTPVPVSSATATVLAGRKVQLSWPAACDPVIPGCGYDIEWKTPGASTFSAWQPVKGVRSVTMTAWQPGGTYVVRVRTVTAVGSVVSKEIQVKAA